MHRALLSEVRFTLKYGELARGQIKVSRRRLRLFEECCIRKAVNERGLNSGPVGLADAISEDEAATGTAFALKQIE